MYRSSYMMRKHNEVHCMYVTDLLGCHSLYILLVLPLNSVKYTGLLALGCVGLLALCDLWQIVADLAVDKVSVCVSVCLC